jgi:hypothetical protein
VKLPEPMDEKAEVKEPDRDEVDDEVKDDILVFDSCYLLIDIV